MTELSNVRITPKSVFFGDVDLTKICPISSKGVQVVPGGSDNFNTVVIEFIVGEIVVEDSL